MDELVELFTFEGRATRSRFGLHLVLDWVLLAAAILTFVILGEAFGPIVVLPLLAAIGLAKWTGLSVIVKRLHDLGRPGWHFLLLAVPIYNLYLAFLMFCREGTVGWNPYGPDPLARHRWYRIEP